MCRCAKGGGRILKVLRQVCVEDGFFRFEALSNWVSAVFSVGNRLGYLGFGLCACFPSSVMK
jgi:hypothetical protein